MAGRPTPLEAKAKRPRSPHQPFPTMFLIIVHFYVRVPFFSFLVICFSALASKDSESEAKAELEAKAA